MGTSYNVIANQQVTEFLTATTSRTVHEITAQSDPSGVVFYTRYVDAAYTAVNIKNTLEPLGAYLNDISNDPGVAGIVIEQDIDVSGQIVEYAVVTVESDSGNSQQTIRDVQTWIFTRDTFDSRVAAARDKLNAIEAL